MVEMIREYPYGPLLAHILGYVSEMNKEELQKIDQKRYAGNLQIGKIGLEKPMKPSSKANLVINKWKRMC